MLIAGEASGDTLAAQLVVALRKQVLALESAPTDAVQPLRTQLAPTFFGAGGSKMAEAGVELAFDMTRHAVVGIPSMRKYFALRRLFRCLLALAAERQPDVIIGVDYGGFNLRFGKAVKKYVRRHRTEFTPWNPKVVQYISPQVWASRSGRAYVIADNYDLLLSIFPFEKPWYARRVPKLHVEFIGHPMLERFQEVRGAIRAANANSPPQVLLLPGSRKSELRRHLPVMLRALELIRSQLPSVKAKMVLPDESLVELAKLLGVNLEIQTGNLSQALQETDVAISKTGTVTMECAYFGVPTVTLYKLSWPEYQYAKQIVTVKTVTMPNLLAGEEVFPEFIQHAATPKNISDAALMLLKDDQLRTKVKRKLAQVIALLGGPGASQRAANAIVELLP